MKRKSKVALITLVVVGITAGSAGLVAAKGRFGGDCGGYGGYGQGPGFSQMGMPRQMNAEDMADRIAFKLDRLKNRLKITSDQEALWSDFEKTVMASAESKFEARKQFAEDGKVTVTERVEVMRGKATQLEEMATVVEKLYAALTPEQQEYADRYRLMPKGKGRHF